LLVINDSRNPDPRRRTTMGVRGCKVDFVRPQVGASQDFSGHVIVEQQQVRR